MEAIMRALVAQFGLPAAEGIFGVDVYEWRLDDGGIPDPVRVLAREPGEVEVLAGWRTCGTLVVTDRPPRTLAEDRAWARDGLVPCLSAADLARRAQGIVGACEPDEDARERVCGAGHATGRAGDGCTSSKSAQVPCSS